MTMYWPGLLLFAAAGYLLWKARQHKAKALAAKAARGGEPEPRLHPSLEVMADAMPFLTVVFTGFTCALIAIAYFVTGAGRFFSLFDLAGVLAAAGAYGYWVVVKSSYRSAYATGPQPQRELHGRRDLQAR
jgi:hypothetical protein